MEQRTGRWVRQPRLPHETEICHCDVCGAVVPDRRWTFEGLSRSLVACSEPCEDLYRSYWLPRYGESDTSGPRA